MSTSNKAISGLYNGVSNQPPEMRLDSQCEVQENFLGTVSRGLEKRQGSEHLLDGESQNLAGLPSLGHRLTTRLIHSDQADSYKEILKTSTPGAPTRPHVHYFQAGDTQADPSIYALGFFNDQWIDLYANATPPAAPDHPLAIWRVDSDTENTSSPTVRALESIPILYPETLDQNTSASRPTIATKPVMCYTYGRGRDSYVPSGWSRYTGPQATFMRPEDMAAVTALDTTFILNRTVTVGMNATTSRDTPGGYVAYVQFRTVLASGKYSLKIDANAPVIKTLSSTPKGSEALYDFYDYVNNTISGFTATIVGGSLSGSDVYGSTLRIVKDDGSDFTIEAGGENDHVQVIKGSINSLSDLPRAAADGDIIQVIEDGAAQGAFSAWYEWDQSEVKWKEAVGPNVLTELDPDTMPLKLVYKVDDGAGTVTGTPDQVYFELTQVDWTDRLVGDDDTNPLPSFVGKQIRDVFFYQNRLGFITNENVVFSQSDDYFNFFSTTVTDTLDSDPIDTTVNIRGASDLQWAVAGQSTVELLGNQSQLSLSSGGSDVLTPRSVVIDPLTNYSLYPQVRPINIANRIYYLAYRYPTRESETFTGEDWIETQSQVMMLESYLDAEGLRPESTDVSAHVQDLLYGNYRYLSAKNNQVIIGGDSEILVYDVFWQGRERVQGSWSKITTEEYHKYLHAGYFRDSLYALTATENLRVDETTTPVISGSAMWERYRLDRGDPLSAGSGNAPGVHPFPPYNFKGLDGYRIVTGTKSGQTVTISETSIGYPSDTLDIDLRMVIADDTTYEISNKGVEAGGTWGFEFAQDISGISDGSVECYVGRPYTATYVPTKMFLRQTGSQGPAYPNGTKRLVSMLLRLVESNYVKLEVIDDRTGNVVSMVSQGNTTVNASGVSLSGATSVVSQDYKFFIRGDAEFTTIRITSDQPLPLRISSYIWEFLFTNRGRII